MRRKRTASFFAYDSYKNKRRNVDVSRGLVFHSSKGGTQMEMHTHRTIVGVFDEPAIASRAVELLQAEGFGGTQISYMDPSQNQASGFLAGLKRLFASTGHEIDAGEVKDDLTHMGLSQDEAEYYSDQYSAGHAIVAVMPESSEQEMDAMEVLRSTGAHNYTTRSSANQMGTTTQPSDYAQTNTDEREETRIDRSGDVPIEGTDASVVGHDSDTNM
jgi:hypothetical protein